MTTLQIHPKKNRSENNMSMTRQLMLVGTMAAAALLTNAALAQQVDHSQHSQHSQHTSQPMDHSQHAAHVSQPMTHGVSGKAPTEAGQDAFAAIQEIVAILSADPDTDWSTVNIDALRDHLVDMHRVTLYENVVSEQIDGGMRYVISGDAETSVSIKRMVSAHASQVSQDSAWSAVTTELPNGLTLLVTTDQVNEVAKIRGLGFAGFMVQGNHHQPHHLMMATGGFGGHQH